MKKIMAYAPTSYNRTVYASPLSGNDGQRGCLESRIPSSLRGGTTKQSSNYQPFLDCFTPFAMTGLGF
jgi:hypothetical protein